MKTPYRVKLLPARPADAKRMVRAMVPEALQNFSFFSGRKRVNASRQAAYLRKMQESKTDLLFLIERREDGALLGTVGLHDCDFVNRNARLGVMIFSPAERGKGYATEAIRLLLRYAFRRRGLNKVYLKVFADNARARARYRKLGFQKEGYLREEYLLKDAYRDMILMALRKREWRAGSATSWAPSWPAT